MKKAKTKSKNKKKEPVQEKEKVRENWKEFIARMDKLGALVKEKEQNKKLKQKIKSNVTI